MAEKWVRSALVALVMLLPLAAAPAIVGAASAAEAPVPPGAGVGAGSEIYWFNGPLAHWPDAWAPIPGLNDPEEGVPAEIDFVGSAASPGAYYAVDENYVYFRVRVSVGQVAAPSFPLTLQDANPPAGWSDRTFRARILLAIDNTGDAAPDWGIAWDTRHWPYFQGGLELLQRDASSGSVPPGVPGWGALQEADGDEAAKISPPDFRWNSTNGYVRTVDQQMTADFGPTTFVDFAISWDFLARQRSIGPQLLPGQVWRVQFVSQAGEGGGGTDVAGSDAMASGTGDWGATIAVNAPPARVAPTQAPPTQGPPTQAPPVQPGAWQRGRFVDFLEFRYPTGWTVTGRGDTSVLRGPYKGHNYVIDVFRPERPVGTSLEGWVEEELTRFRANLDRVTVRSLTFARVPATRVGLLNLPGGDACPVVRVYAWSEDPPIPGIRQAMLTISQADEKDCDSNRLNTFVDMLMVMANK